MSDKRIQYRWDLGKAGQAVAAMKLIALRHNLPGPVTDWDTRVITAELPERLVAEYEAEVARLEKTKAAEQAQFKPCRRCHKTAILRSTGLCAECDDEE